MPLLIEDYALIGDCQTAGLVGRNGSLDWLCFPRFDSPACFAALLGTSEHGRWSLAPAEPVAAVRRCYRDGTLVLETEFETASGRVAVIDFMPPRTDTPDVIRIVEGRGGQVAMQMELIIRFDYGSIVPWVRRTEGGLRAIAGPETLHLQTPIEMRGQNMHTVGEFQVAAGQRVPFVLAWSRTHEPAPPPVEAEEQLLETERWWREWSGRCAYQGPWREAVLRSLITLKALTYAPTGGLVAAATTSLPEKIGGVRNWDYRYCWLRDASFTLNALITAGYVDEAAQWRDWLVHAVAGTPEQIQIMYGLAGERRLTELELDWLPGYEDSRPVRIGNAAADQHQLDIYGQVMDTLYLARRAGLEADDNSWRIQQGMMRFLESDWHKPDEGIWEIRGPKQHFVHSKVMAWLAADRAIASAEQFQMPGDVVKWRRLQEEIYDQVCSQGFDSQRNTFVQHYGAKHVDASLLTLSLVGFVPPDDPRMMGTVAAIRRDLDHGGLIERYPTEVGVDGLPPGEGAFLLCNFWLADCLMLQGDADAACELFERLLGLRNDVGLLAEEYDVEHGRQLGNFPQAFSHLGIINTACTLARVDGPPEDHGVRQRSEPRR